jgi:hypothetical protein
LSKLPAPDVAGITKRLAKNVASCSSEEDLRIAVEIILREAIPDLPTPKYEKAVRTSAFRGRADAVHHGVVIEYEKPRSMRSARVREHAVKQACDYLTGFALVDSAGKAAETPASYAAGKAVYSQDEEERLAANVGLAIDGETIVFIQRRNKSWHEDTQKLDEDAVEKLLLWLRAMVRKDLSPENLISDFGPETKLAADAVGIFAKLVASGEHPKANVIYDEWRRMFGIVYGTEQLERHGKSPEAQSLQSAYQIEIGVKFPVLLFAVHTYYALLMKMLATELIVAQGGLGDTFIGNLARGKLRKQLSELESGDILQRYNIRNAIEQDFFGWYTDAWTADVQQVLWQMVEALRGYDIGTFQLKPERARDLLKDLYHGLIPDSVRHALGEYYTPDWLAEKTINESGFDGDPRQAFLDPSCGSGTFLILAIERVRQWLADRSVEWGSNEKKREAVDLIRHHIVGFDLNPLAVIASRTNYLFALGPLLRYRGSGSDFEIPVYLTDSVLLPGRTLAQQDLYAQNTVRFPMAVGTFELPREVVDGRSVPDLMNILHEAIVENHSREAFVRRSISDLKLAEGGPLLAALGNLFDAMKRLDTQGKNRVWAKLIRNRYASLLFREYFDFVVGNPPHVNWESLTPEWRAAAEDEYKHYGLFTLKGLESRHGGGKKDIAALFTYAVIDHFLKKGGVLALVVHVSLFKASGAGEGFRRFQLGNGERFKIDEAHDYSSFQPFLTHAGMKIKTRTVTFRAVKGSATDYPVPYTRWDKATPGFVPGGLRWDEAKTRLAPIQLVATPLRGTTTKEARWSPWLTVQAAAVAKCKKIIAPIGYEPSYAGHAGAFTGGLNGAYFVEILRRDPDGKVLVRNLHDVGKIKCPKVQLPLEADLLYPLLRGRSIARWRFETNAYVLMVQDPKTQKGYPERWLQETHPLTWAYLRKFEKLLRARKAFLKFFDPDKDPFYSMYDVAEYTFSQYKIAWMDISSTVKATVVAAPTRAGIAMPEHTVMFISTDALDEAHYLAAVLNSKPVNTVVSGYIVDNHISTHPIENIVIPKFDAADSTKTRLAALSLDAHAATSRGDTAAVSKIEKDIDRAVEALW